MALFVLMPVISNAQQSETVVIGIINPALYKVAGDLTIQSFTLSPTTINVGETVMSVVRWVSVSGGAVKVKLPYPGGAADSTTVNAIAGTVYETRFWRNVVAAAGTYTLTVSVIKGSETATATATLVVNGPVNQPPVVTSVTITGNTIVGSTLTGGYTYFDVDGDLQGVSTFKWYRNNVIIAGATSITYLLTTADLSATIKFEVTPVAQTGASPGLPVQSSAVGPVVNPNQP
ncbi:MAG: hypothetical protein HY973_04295, partial [Candidatus Kerfeldbacteria bacterium]|nr:hypothetical protein [Candidatus Kerfeldbacteria bacterium]